VLCGLCSCLGISLVPDPPLTAEYRSTGTPFITLRCFSGEIYREGQVWGHALD
jgi:hypothetical protein